MQQWEENWKSLVQTLRSHMNYWMSQWEWMIMKMDAILPQVQGRKKYPNPDLRGLY